MNYRVQTLKNWRTKSKYRNVSTEYEGKRYDSKLEAKIAQDLDWRVKSGELKSWTRQVKIDLRIFGWHITNHYVDFRLEYQNGSIEYLEAKGFETEVWRMKRNLFLALLPEIEPGAEYRVVKSDRGNWNQKLKKKVA